MHGPLSSIIAVLICLLAVWITWRTKPATPPYGGRLIKILLLGLAQVGLVAAVAQVVNPLLGDRPYSDQALFNTVAATSVFHALRLGILFLTLRLWTGLVVGSIARKWIYPLYPIAFLSVRFGSGFLVVATLIYLWFWISRTDWADQIGGARRVASLAGALLCIVLYTPIIFSPIGLGFGETPAISGPIVSRSRSGLLDEAPSGALPIAFASRPLAEGAIALTMIFWIQAITSFLSLIVPRIRFRNHRLARRFSFTYALLLLVPGALLLLAFLLSTYYNTGSSKGERARAYLQDDLNRAIERAGEALAIAGPNSDDWSGLLERASAGQAGASWIARSWAPGDSLAEILASVHADSMMRGEALFESAGYDTVSGLYVSDEGIWLAAGVAATAGDRGRTSIEVYMPIEDSYLVEIADGLNADLRVEALGATYLTNSGFTSFRSQRWLDENIVIQSEQFTEGASGFWRRPRRVSRIFLSTGDWIHREPDERRGGISLAVISSPARFAGELFSDNTFLYLHGWILAVLGGIFLIIGLAVHIATGMGRSIVGGVLNELDALAEGVGRIGEGDLDHRVELQGKGEIADLANGFNDMAANLKEHQEQLIEKERLEADLAVARDIQARLLPQSPPELDELDIAGISIPSKEVGGDLFYFLRLSKDLLGVALGDVSGKSVPAALLMSNVLAALKTEAQYGDRADRSLESMNKLVADQVEPGRFVTFFYGIIDTRTGVLRYACAGHNPSLIVSADGSQRWLEESGLPLGIMASSEYVIAEENLVPGDVLLLYSDGVTEAEAPMRVDEIPAADDATVDGYGDGLDDHFFGEERLSESIRELREGSAHSILGGLLDAIRRFTAGAEQSDDLTVVVVKVNQ